VDEVILLPASERAALFQETAARKSVSSVIAMEKDFWVCWMLRLVFLPPVVEGMVFKGGTSLSKVYGAINRFSEDVDLSIPRQSLGFSGDHDVHAGLSKTKRRDLLKDMKDACEGLVSGKLRDVLHERIANAFAIAGELRDTWSVDLATNDAGTLLFSYPPSLSADAYGVGGYIRPVIRLEFGGRNEVWPAEVRTIRPYCLEAFPDLSANPSCEVNVLAAERTFWEKATLIHAEYHRPEKSPRPERVSRHYSDLARLARTEVGTRAIGNIALLQAVADHKASYFPSNWARYDEATSGRIRLVPHEGLEHQLRTDYAAMREMFFDDPEPFDAVLAELARVEGLINHPSPRATQPNTGKEAGR
jgi:hypothetical protein